MHAGSALFWCRDARDLPADDTLQRAAKRQLQGVLCFSRWPSAPEKARCVSRVQTALPDCSVSSGFAQLGFDFIYFGRGLRRDEVLHHASELVASAREFGILATELAHALAAHVGISAAQLAAHGQYQAAEVRFERRGHLNDDWDYGFHGFQCIFKHRQTGQEVDIEFGFGEEFGVLDPMFWLRFLQTTPHYSHLSDWLSLGYGDAKAMFDALVGERLLVVIEGEISNAHNEASWQRRGYVPALDR